MSYSPATEEYKGYIIEIHQEEYPCNPREEFDQLTTMVCWHNRYVLGDVRPDCSPAEYIADICGLDMDDLTLAAEEWINDQEGILEGKYDEEIKDAVAEAIYTTFDEKFSHKPLFMYDHSGITISTSPFSCPWDSGQIGFVHAPKEGRTEEELEEIIENEVQEYDNYLTGQVYGYVIRKPYGDKEILSSCYGFYGLDFELSDLLPVARQVIDREIENG